MLLGELPLLCKPFRLEKDAAVVLAIISEHERAATARAWIKRDRQKDYLDGPSLLRMGRELSPGEFSTVKSLFADLTVRSDPIVQRSATGRQPAARASASEQNQRSPLASLIRTLPYHGLHGM